jgi:hypothetical protein
LLSKSARLAIVPNAGHLLDDPGSLERVIGETQSWFARTLEPRTTRDDA